MRPASVALAGLLALALVAVPGATAANEPVGGCGSDATVEVCQVVCITEPCDPPYVCINTRVADPCVYP